MMIKNARHIICILCLLIAGMGCVTAGTSSNAQVDKHNVKESATIDLLPKKKLRDFGKVTFRCRISKFGNNCMMLAKVLKNDSAMHIVKPGVTFVLENGESVTLKPRRAAACCSDWADGRWYNSAFNLGDADIRKMKSSGIVSVSIHLPGGVVSRDVASDKKDAVGKQLKSVEGE